MRHRQTSLFAAVPAALRRMEKRSFTIVIAMTVAVTLVAESASATPTWPDIEEVYYSEVNVKLTAPD